MRHYSEELGFYNYDPSDCEGCGGRGCTINVHHISPQRFSAVNLGWTPEQIDSPYNAISVFQCEHTGKMGNGQLVDPTTDFVLHPDNITALENYRQGITTAYQDMFALRNALAEAGETYWNTDHDAEMLEQVKLLTDNVVAQGWIWPTVNHRK